MSEEKIKVVEKSSEPKRGRGRPKGSTGIKYTKRKKRTGKKVSVSRGINAKEIIEIVNICKAHGIKVFNYRDLYISFDVENKVTSNEIPDAIEKIEGKVVNVVPPVPADPSEPQEPEDDFFPDEDELEQMKITDPLEFEKIAMGEGLNEEPQRP